MHQNLKFHKFNKSNFWQLGTRTKGSDKERERERERERKKERERAII